MAVETGMLILYICIGVFVGLPCLIFFCIVPCGVVCHFTAEEGKTREIPEAYKE